MAENDLGVSLVEVLIAVLIAIIGVFSLGGVIFQATAANKNQGTETTRTTIYAQDKLEFLLSLDFVSCSELAPSTPLPVDCNATGIDPTNASSPWNKGLTVGASGVAGVLGPPAQTSCPAAGSAYVGYMDFLDANGLQFDDCANPAMPAYIRQWQIRNLNLFGSYPALKQISVAVYSLSAVNVASTGVSGKPIVVVTSFLSQKN